MSDTGIFLSLGLLSLLKAICHKTVNQEEHISRKITIFDATLCDGEQSPGASMNTEEKLFIARQLVRMNVDVIEAGFPISSPGDFRSVQEIGKIAGDRCTVCGLTRAVDRDIEVAAEALKTAQRPRIHTGLGVSTSHLRDKLHMTEEKGNLSERSMPSNMLASSFDDVEFLCRGCRPLRSGVSGAHYRGGRKGRCHGREHPRYDGLQHAVGLWRPHP